MNILLIGHSVIDIFEDGEKQIEKPGGIFFSVTGLSLLKNENDKIFLLSSMDKNNNELFKKSFANVDSRFVQFCSEIPHVNLTLCRNNERGEKYKNLTDKLDIGVIEDFSVFDGILVNMITGFDIDLHDLKFIRKKFKGLIYFDVHTLSRGLDDQNRRLFRTVPDADQWIDNVDIVQVNENELRTIARGSTEKEMAGHVLGLRPQLLIITLDDKGAKVYYRVNDSIICKFEPSIEIEAINQIGCGDVFGAAFFYSYILRNDICESLKKANISAGVITNYSEFDNLELIKNDIFKRFG